MEEIKYEKLDRIRDDIKRDKEKVSKLQEQIKAKEAKLKEAEASQIVTDVGAMNMTPEQLGKFLSLIKSDQLNAILSGKVNILEATESKDEVQSYTDNYKEDEEELEDEENELEGI